MAVKIVTDSTADLSPELVKQNNITVVPLYVRFGEKNYRDGVDISLDEFYAKLVDGKVPPSTSQPTPADFAQVYRKLAAETDEILSIHLSSKFSGTCNAALQGKEIVGKKANITVIDSCSVSMGLGMTAMVGARLASAGSTLQQVVNGINQSIRNTHLMGTFDTLKYLVLGGRIGKAKALLGSVLNVKPVLVMKEGELHPVSNVRTHTKGIEKLIDFVKETLHIEELTIIHTTTPDEANSVKTRFVSAIQNSRLHVARLGPVLGTYGGPGMLAVAFRSGSGSAENEPKSGKLLLERIPKIHKPDIHIPKIGR